MDLTNPKHAKVYADVHRKILWDEPLSDITHLFEVNGIDEPLASAMLRHARADRIAHLRSASLPRIVLGLVMTLAGLGLFFGLALSTGYTTRNIFILSGLAFLFGIWKLVGGFVDFIIAPKKRGSITDDL